ncbi:hypothetical protein GCM10010840_17910 [Deinococcus aerolatus]|uniref:Uncharacterized protein n=1 Tax=Deinococcus aerolatus TaxID=522487 RepID=A0ABQ2G8W1_9DEIO|nr:hypothetical protein GCM10010840_17910 [Deinococcus aerolatus]
MTGMAGVAEAGVTGVAALWEVGFWAEAFWATGSAGSLGTADDEFNVF